MGRRGSRAVVLGASLAGLMTARVLSETFDSVTLVDRDSLPDGPVPRRGVPQGWQSHGLHARGREVLEDLFPGLTDELVAHGASLGDVQADVTWVNDGHRLRRAVSGMQGIAFTRPLLEDRVRVRVRSLPGVTLRAPVDVLELTADGDRVTGVRLRERGAHGDPETLAADLVVDATGRGSHSPVWLEELGYVTPDESAIDVGVGYTTWEFPRRSGDQGGDIAIIIGGTVACPRFGAALAAEGDRWQVTAGATSATTPPPPTSPPSAPSPPPCPRRTSAISSPTASRWPPAGCTGSRAAAVGTTSG
jgi:flavin-dependent dehydrogenase